MRTTHLVIGLFLLIACSLVQCQPFGYEDAEVSSLALDAETLPEVARPKRFFFFFNPDDLWKKFTQFSSFYLAKSKSEVTTTPRPRTKAPKYTTVKPIKTTTKRPRVVKTTTTESVIGFVVKKTHNSKGIRIEKQWITPRTTTTTKQPETSSGEEVESVDNQSSSPFEEPSSEQPDQEPEDQTSEEQPVSEAAEDQSEDTSAFPDFPSNDNDVQSEDVLEQAPVSENPQTDADASTEPPSELPSGFTYLKQQQELDQTPQPDIGEQALENPNQEIGSRVDAPGGPQVVTGQGYSYPEPQEQPKSPPNFQGPVSGAIDQIQGLQADALGFPIEPENAPDGGPQSQALPTDFKGQSSQGQPEPDQSQAFQGPPGQGSAQDQFQQQQGFPSAPEQPQGQGFPPGFQGQPPQGSPQPESNQVQGGVFQGPPGQGASQGPFPGFQGGLGQGQFQQQQGFPGAPAQTQGQGFPSNFQGQPPQGLSQADQSERFQGPPGQGSNQNQQQQGLLGAPEQPQGQGFPPGFQGQPPQGSPQPEPNQAQGGVFQGPSGQGANQGPFPGFQGGLGQGQFQQQQGFPGAPAQTQGQGQGFPSNFQGQPPQGLSQADQSERFQGPPGQGSNQNQQQQGLLGAPEQSQGQGFPPGFQGQPPQGPPQPEPNQAQGGVFQGPSGQGANQGPFPGFQGGLGQGQFQQQQGFPGAPARTQGQGFPSNFQGQPPQGLSQADQSQRFQGPPGQGPNQNRQQQGLLGAPEQPQGQGFPPGFQGQPPQGSSQPEPNQAQGGVFQGPPGQGASQGPFPGFQGGLGQGQFQQQQGFPGAPAQTLGQGQNFLSNFQGQPPQGVSQADQSERFQGPPGQGSNQNQQQQGLLGAPEQPQGQGFPPGFQGQPPQGSPQPEPNQAQGGVFQGPSGQGANQGPFPGFQEGLGQGQFQQQQGFPGAPAQSQGQGQGLSPDFQGQPPQDLSQVDQSERFQGLPGQGSNQNQQQQGLLGAPEQPQGQGFPPGFQGQPPQGSPQPEPNQAQGGVFQGPSGQGANQGSFPGFQGGLGQGQFQQQQGFPGAPAQGQGYPPKLQRQPPQGLFQADQSQGFQEPPGQGPNQNQLQQQQGFPGAPGQAQGQGFPPGFQGQLPQGPPQPEPNQAEGGVFQRPSGEGANQGPLPGFQGGLGQGQFQQQQGFPGAPAQTQGQGQGYPPNFQGQPPQGLSQAEQDQGLQGPLGQVSNQNQLQQQQGLPGAPGEPQGDRLQGQPPPGPLKPESNQAQAEGFEGPLDQGANQSEADPSQPTQQELPSGTMGQTQSQSMPPNFQGQRPLGQGYIQNQFPQQSGGAGQSQGANVFQGFQGPLSQGVTTGFQNSFQQQAIQGTSALISSFSPGSTGTWNQVQGLSTGIQEQFPGNQNLPFSFSGQFGQPPNQGAQDFSGQRQGQQSFQATSQQNSNLIGGLPGISSQGQSSGTKNSPSVFPGQFGQVPGQSIPTGFPGPSGLGPFQQTQGFQAQNQGQSLQFGPLSQNLPPGFQRPAGQLTNQDFSVGPSESSGQSQAQSSQSCCSAQSQGPPSIIPGLPNQSPFPSGLGFSPGFQNQGQGLLPGLLGQGQPTGENMAGPPQQGANVPQVQGGLQQNQNIPPGFQESPGQGPASDNLYTQGQGSQMQNQLQTRPNQVQNFPLDDQSPESSPSSQGTQAQSGSTENNNSNVLESSIDPFQQPGPSQSNFNTAEGNESSKPSADADVVQLTSPGSDADLEGDKSIGLDNISRVSGPGDESQFVGDIRRATDVGPTGPGNDAVGQQQFQQGVKKRTRNTPRNVLDYLRRDNQNRRRLGRLISRE